MKEDKTLKPDGNALAADFTLGSLLRFAFPTVFMMLFMGLYTIVDSIFVSRFVNTNALSALNIVCPVINVTVGIGTMLATGSSAIIARKMGAGEEERASRDFTLILLTGTGIGIVIAVLGLIWIDDLIWVLGASKILFPYCKAYLSVLLLFTPVSILQVLFQNLFVTAGRPGLGMILSVSAGAANILFDYLFIVPLRYGIAGSALGTGIGYTIPAAAGVVFFLQKNHTLKFRMPVRDFKVVKESCFNGFSEMVGQAAAAITTFLFNRTMMKLLGESGVAAITIIIYSQFLLSTLYIGFSIGTAPIISYNYGSGNHLRLHKIFTNCVKVIAAGSIFMFAVSMCLGGSLVRIFSARGTDVYRIARQGYSIFSFSFLFCGLNIFTSAIFTALSNGKISAVISFLRTFGFITAGLLLLPVFFHVTGVWLAIPAAEFLSIIVSFYFLKKYKAVYRY